MSQPTKPFHGMGVDKLTKELPDLLGFEQNKPDFKEIDLGSHYQTKPTHPLPTLHISPNKNDVNNRTQQNHSGELIRSAATSRNSKPGHRRSSSTGAPLIYSGSPGSGSSSSSSSSSSGGNNNNNNTNSHNIISSSAVSSSPSNILYPAGNICPSGKILKSNMLVRTGNRGEKLGSGAVNYGHGNIMKRGNVATPTTSCDAEEVKKMGNDMYRRGNFSEALVLYERAIGISPDNAAYRSNKAAALTMLGRVGEAVRECEEAVSLDSAYGRAHQRLASLYLRLGQIEKAQHHLYFNGQNPDTTEVQKLHSLESHINRCSDARKLGNWKAVLRECGAAMVAGAVSSPQLVACKAEAFLKLQQYADADSSLSDLPKVEPYPASCSHTKFFGILAEAYVLYVQAMVDMVFGRFENAAAAAEKAGLIDYNNIEVAMLLNNVKLVSRARSQGKDLFNAGKFAEASAAYGEGLKYNLCNSILYCNRAVCWSKLGLWEQSVEECNHALKIQPNYTKALLRRAVSNAKLERWVEAVRDYEVLKRELPGDIEVIESLSHAQDALTKSSLDHTYYSKPVIARALPVSDRFNGPTCLPGGSQAEPSRSRKKCPEL